MASLSPKEIAKYDHRRETFLKMFEDEIPFVLMDGGTVVLEKDTRVVDIIESGSQVALRQLLLKGTDGKTYRLSDLKKTADFGGMDKVRGVTVEERVTKYLNQQIEEFGGVVSVEIPGGLAEVATFTNLQPGATNPKADLFGLDRAGNPTLFFSYKKYGQTSGRWQQWGGLSEQREAAQFAHPETQRFIRDVQMRVDDTPIEPGTFWKRHIKDRDVRMRAVYGQEFGGAFSPLNVHFLLYGSVYLRLSVVDGVNRVDVVGDTKYWNGEELPEEMTPVFGLRYSDRKDFGIEKARIAIFPRDYRPGVWI